MFSFIIEQLQLKPSCYFRQIFILNRSTDLKNSRCASCRLGSVIFTRAYIWPWIWQTPARTIFFHVIFIFWLVWIWKIPFYINEHRCSFHEVDPTTKDFLQLFNWIKLEGSWDWEFKSDENFFFKFKVPKVQFRIIKINLENRYYGTRRSITTLWTWPIKI